MRRENSSMPLHQSKTLEYNKWKVTKLSPSLNPKCGLPPLVDEVNFCNLLGFNGKFPWFVVHNQKQCYRMFYIDKDTKQIHNEFNPDLNLRTIAAPIAALKELQGRIAATYLNKLPKHEANYAYMRGKNIKMAAENHKDSDVLIKIDLKDFFPSHKDAYIRNKLHHVTGYEKQLCWFISKICTLDGALPQGAATSPVLSIVLNYEMDARLAELATAAGLVYTRYADDLCFSGVDRDNKQCWDFVRAIAKAVFPFRVNWDKVAVMRNKAYSYVCGVTITDPPAKTVEAMIKIGECDGYVLKRKDNKVEYTKLGREPMSDAELAKLKDTLAHTAPDTPLNIEPKRWYVQSIKRMLGLHLTNGVRFPRAKYNQLRMEAMLVAKGAANVNAQRFKGRLAYLRMVDPAKAQKIDQVMLKHRGA
jgi:hypothetical protein